MRLRSLRLANLATSSFCAGSPISCFLVSASGLVTVVNSTLYVLPALNDGMAEYALKTEHHLIDIGDAHEPDLALPLQGFRSGDFAQPGKSARLVAPCVADQEDVRTSGPWVAHFDSGAALSSVLTRQGL